MATTTYHPVARDLNYRIVHLGKGKGFVATYKGETIATSRFYNTLVARCVGHASATNGALIIEAVE